MKIAIFSETYLYEKNGVATHIKVLRDGLEKNGHQVIVVTSDKHCKHHYLEDGILHCPSVEFKQVYGVGLAFPISTTRLKMVRDFDPDVIHVHNEFGVGWSGILIAKLLKKPVVYTLHTSYDNYIYYIAPKVFLKIATKLLHQYGKLFANFTTLITGPSQKCDSYLTTMGVTKEFNLIQNSADLATFDPTRIGEKEKKSTREKYALSDKKVAIFIGRLATEKNLSTLFEFFAKNATTKLKNWRLLIVGDGPQKKELEKLAQKLKIKTQVIFAGTVNNNDIPDLLAIAQVYLSASLSEMQSVSILEAMAMSVPVVQLFDHANKSQVTNGVNGFTFHDVKEMAAVLQQIETMSATDYKKLQKQTRASVLGLGSNDLAKQMLAIYQKSLKILK